MDLISFVAGVGIGGVLAAVVAWLAARLRHAREAAALQAEAARLVAQLDAERRTATERRAAIEDAQLRLRDGFAALSAEALRQNSQSFLELARASLRFSSGRWTTEEDVSIVLQELPKVIARLRGISPLAKSKKGV